MEAGLIHLLIMLVVWGIVAYVLWWGVGKIGLPEPFGKIATVLLVVATVIVLLYLLMGFVGAPALHLPR